MTQVMQGPLFFDEPTDHRIEVSNRPRVVYVCRDFNGEFVRFVAYKTPQEIRREQNKYSPVVNGRRKLCIVGILPTWEVCAWEIGL